MNCYILAGGRSRRMGQPKAAITFGASTFLEIIVDAASSAFDRVIAVDRVRDTDSETQRLRGDAAVSDSMGLCVSESGVPTIHEDEHEEEGPIFAVQRALRDAAGRCFIVALDYPLITADVLRYLRDRFEAGTATALIPVWSEMPQRLCAGYDASLLPRIAERISLRRFDLRGFAPDAELVPEDELRSRFRGEPLMNVNTPEDLERARQIHERLLAPR